MKKKPFEIWAVCRYLVILTFEVLIILKCHTLSATDGGIGHPPFKQIKNMRRKCGSRQVQHLLTRVLYHEIYIGLLCDIAKGKLRGKYTFKMRFRWKKLRATKYIYYSNKKNNLCWKVTPVHPELQEISRLWLITGNKETDDRFSFTHFFFLFGGGALISSGKFCFCHILAFYF